MRESPKSKHTYTFRKRKSCKKRLLTTIQATHIPKPHQKKSSLLYHLKDGASENKDTLTSSLGKKFRFHPTVPSSCLIFSPWPCPHVAHITPPRTGHTCHRSSSWYCYRRFLNTRYIVALYGPPIALCSQRPADWTHSESHLFRNCAYCRSCERWMLHR